MWKFIDWFFHIKSGQRALIRQNVHQMSDAMLSFLVLYRSFWKQPFPGSKNIFVLILLWIMSVHRCREPNAVAPLLPHQKINSKNKLLFLNISFTLTVRAQESCKVHCITHSGVGRINEIILILRATNSMTIAVLAFICFLWVRSTSTKHHSQCYCSLTPLISNPA